MKRYLAFYGDDFYACGGMNDFIGDYDSMEDAKVAIEERHKKNRPDDEKWEWSWGHIWDTETQEIIEDLFE